MKKNTLFQPFNEEAYSKALKAHHLTDADVAEMMGISPVTLWRKKNGKTDFCGGEMMAFRTKAHLTEQEARAIFFSGPASR